MTVTITVGKWGHQAAVGKCHKSCRDRERDADIGLCHSLVLCIFMKSAVKSCQVSGDELLLHCY